MKNINLCTRTVGMACEPFIIAEAGINHNGDIELAKRMILAAKDAGVDAVKFQTFHAEEFIQDREMTYTYRSQGKTVTESMLDMFKRNEFSRDEWWEIKRFCEEQQIAFLSTPQNESDLALLLDLGIDAIKIGSDDFVNIPLVRHYAGQGLPILLSCGMADQSEIDRTLAEVANCGNKDVVLLLCTSQYPTPPEDANISKLKTMAERYPDVVLGFSDHTQGSEAAVMATTLGARVFEKHFTLSHDMPGPDHWFSEEPESLANWTQSIRKAYKMVGSAELKPTVSERAMRELAHRSITALGDIKAGEMFTNDNLGMRRPGTGIPASEWDNVIGRQATRHVSSGEQISWGDVQQNPETEATV